MMLSIGGSNFEIYQVHNLAASCKLGSGGNWCISTRNISRNYFKSYHDQGLDILIIHTDQGGPWAVIYNPDRGKIYEVQNANNDLGADNENIKKFMHQLSDVGVDMEEFTNAFPFGSNAFPKTVNELTLEESYEIYLDERRIDNFTFIGDVYDAYQDLYWDDFDPEVEHTFFMLMSSHTGKDVDTVTDITLPDLITFLIDNDMRFNYSGIDDIDPTSVDGWKKILNDPIHDVELIAVYLFKSIFVYVK